MELISISDLLIPDGKIYGIFTNFCVKRIRTGEVYRYQYFSWKRGRDSGAKGVVLAKEGDEYAHIAYLRGFSFAVGGEAFDCFGGFAEGNDELMRERFKTELSEELGIEASEIVGQVEDLGRIIPDRGMTNNNPRLYWAVISRETMEKIVKKPRENPDPYEMRAEAKFCPISELWGENSFLLKNEDAMFLACVARLVAKGVLVPN